MQQIYESPWHNPVAFWVAAALFAAALARHMPPLVAFLALFGVEIAADALLTGGLTPLPASSPASTPVAVLFVILGDLRYFWLLGRFSTPNRSFLSPPVMGGALAAALVVPLVSFVVPRLAPGAFATPRATFLLYEALFACLTMVVSSAWLPRVRARAGAASAKYLTELTVFEAAQYGLWAVADVAILAGAPEGFGLRIVPNAMYYALFLPFALARAPREVLGR